MSLSWTDETALARALCAAYPDVDRLALSSDSILALVKDLPDFRDPATPPPRKIEAVLWNWMRLADAQDHGGR